MEWLFWGIPYYCGMVEICFQNQYRVYHSKSNNKSNQLQNQLKWIDSIHSNVKYLLLPIIEMKLKNLMQIELFRIDSKLFFYFSAH